MRPLADRLAQPAQPAAIVRDHAERLEHVAMLALAAVVAAVDHFVDRGAHRLDRGLQPLELRVDVVGDDLGDDDARLMQHGVAEPQAFGDRRALDRERPADRDRRRLAGERLQFARGDHLGEQHRGRLQRLDLFLGIGAARAVLHDQHAERRAAAQHGHAEERLVDLFAGLRLVGERGMVLRVGERERLGGGGDEADEALRRAASSSDAPLRG